MIFIIVILVLSDEVPACNSFSSTSSTFNLFPDSVPSNNSLTTMRKDKYARQVVGTECEMSRIDLSAKYRDLCPALTAIVLRWSIEFTHVIITVYT